MDFNSNHLILAVVAVIVVILVRTLFLASKAINSSDKFPIASNDENKRNNDDSP